MNAWMLSQWPEDRFALLQREEQLAEAHAALIVARALRAGGMSRRDVRDLTGVYLAPEPDVLGTHSPVDLDQLMRAHKAVGETCRVCGGTVPGAVGDRQARSRLLRFGEAGDESCAGLDADGRGEKV